MSLLLKNKKVISSLLLIIFISSLGIFVFGVKEVQAIDLGVKQAVLSATATALSWLLWGIGELINLAQKVITGLLSWTNFQKSEIVTKGWEKVRDITNLFFVLVLLIIAFATILRLETYGMKQLLWKLIVAALLINFSLIIGGIFIDFSNVLTNYFVQALQGTENIGERIAANLKIQKVFTPIVTTTEGQERFYACVSDEDTCWDRAGEIGAEGATCFCGGIDQTDCSGERIRQYCEQQGCSPDQWLLNCSGLTDEARTAITKMEEEGWGDTSSQLGKTIIALLLSNLLLLVAFVCFALFALLLLIRIIILWFLLIIAPIVWLFWILPVTAHLFTKWWDNLLKWSFFAPIYLFFIWLALSTWNTFLGEQGFSGATSRAMQSGPAVEQFLPALYSPQTFMGFAVLVGILIGGLIAAQKMGVAGAGAAIGIGKFLAYGAGRAASRWAARGAPIPIVPERARKWVSRQVGRLPRPLEMGLRAAWAPRRVIPMMASPQLWSRFLASRRARADERSFDLGAGDMEDTWEAIRHPIDFARGRRTYFKERRRSGLVEKRMKEFANIKDEEQLVQMRKGAKDDIDREALDRRLAIMAGVNTFFASEKKKLDPAEFTKYLKQTYGPDQGPVLGADISAMAGAQGNYSLVGASEWNRKKQRMDFVSPKRQAEIAVTRARELDPGKLMGQIHPDSFFSRDPVKGHTGEIHLTGEALLRHVISPAHVEQAYRLQPRATESIVKFGPQIEEVAERIGGRQEIIIKSFVAKVRKQKGEEIFVPPPGAVPIEKAIPGFPKPPPPGEMPLEERERLGRP